jgi:hypothetical protein
MKTLFVLVSIAIATPVFAQTMPAPAPSPAPAAPAAATKLNLDTPIETIVANPAGKAVLDKDLPGLTTHAMYDSFKSMSLKALQPMSNGALTDAQLTQVQTDLAAIK